MADSKLYSVRTEIKLDWSEMDMFGHINNVSYFKFIQASRVNFWEIIGLTKQYEQNRVGATLAAASCKFIAPLHYPGVITVQARVAFINNSSFGFQHQILNSEGTICAEAEDVMVLFDFNTNSKVLIPTDLRDKLEQLM